MTLKILKMAIDVKMKRHRKIRIFNVKSTPYWLLLLTVFNIILVIIKYL